jgi:hypothetical protein
MSSKAVKISIMLLSLLALAVPSPAKSAAGEAPSDPFVSTEATPTNLHIGESALASVKLNNVPTMQGWLKKATSLPPISLGRSR